MLFLGLDYAIHQSTSLKQELLLIANATQFNQAVKESWFLVALVVKKDNTKDEETPEEIQQLLASYDDVVSTHKPPNYLP